MKIKLFLVSPGGYKKKGNKSYYIKGKSMEQVAKHTGEPLENIRETSSACKPMKKNLNPGLTKQPRRKGQKVERIPQTRIPFKLGSKWINKDCPNCIKLCFGQVETWHCNNKEILKKAKQIPWGYRVLHKCCGVFNDKRQK